MTDSTSTQTYFVAGLLVTLLAVPVIAIAVTDPAAVEQGTTWNATDGPAVVLGEDDNLDLSQPFPANDTVALGDATISGQSMQVTAAGLTGARTTVAASGEPISSELALNRTDTNLSAAATSGRLTTLGLDSAAAVGDGSRDLTVGAGSNALTVQVRGLTGVTAVSGVDVSTGQVVDSALVTGGTASLTVGAGSTRQLRLTPAPLPYFGTASPNGTTRAPGETVPLDIGVEHSEFPNETVDVDFYEYDSGNPNQDPQLGTDNVTTPGTANISGVSVGGGLSWYASADDGNGQSDISAVFQISTAGVLDIRDDESGSLVDNRTVQLDVTGPGFSQVYNISDGRFNYSTLPADADEDVVIDIRAKDYYQASIQVPSLATNDTIYLQRGPNWAEDPGDDDPTDNPDPGNDDDKVLIRFELVDQTGGNFPAENSTLRVETANGTLVHSETFGPLNRVDVVLEQGERYQLQVDGPQDTRSLGGFTASESETVPITIEGQDFELPEAGPYFIDSSLTKQQSVNFIVVEFSDPAENTSELSITIRERDNESNVIYTETVTDLGNYSAQVAITDNQSAMQWVVDYNGTRNGQSFSGQIPVGGDSLVPLPGGTILTAFVLVGLTMIAALYSGPIAALGSIILVAVSGGAILYGWLPVSPLVWFVAAVVAVGGFARSVNTPFG